MNIRLKCFILLLCINFFIPGLIQAQDSLNQKLILNGYISFTESVMDLNLPYNDALWESLLHNRLNMYYYPSNKWSFSLQLRNRLIAGDRIKSDFGKYRRSISNDAGIVDLSKNIVSEESFLFNTAVDRLWARYSHNKLDITIGRQRINWGLTYVWNPNDWFNNYSFFDIDYIERPGSDAVRLQYFGGMLSTFEAVVKYDSTKRITFAGLYKTNFHKFDLQFLVGLLEESDLSLGFGWAGEIGQIGFKGEVSYLHPVKKISDTTGLILASLALDYTFPNSLMLQIEGFFNQKRKGEESFIEYYERPSSVKDLSFTELNLMAQISYPITPILNGSMAAIYFPKVKGYYLGPSIIYSLNDNLEFAIYLQYLNGEFLEYMNIKERQSITTGFARLKWNF